MKTSNRAEVSLLVILVIAAAGGVGLWAAKPKFMHGDSKRAAASTEATAKLDAAATKQGAEAAASVVKIGEANTTAPESRERDFIAREVPVALAKLPAPDPQALVEAERRKAAVLEGRLKEVSRLYDAAMQRADVLERERAAALAERRKADADLEQIAAERLGAERVRNRAFLVAGLLALLFLYVKFTHLSPGALAEAVTDIRGGREAVTAIDGVTTRAQQKIVRIIARLTQK